jgi:hypothetical protein
MYHFMSHPIGVYVCVLRRLEKCTHRTCELHHTMRENKTELSYKKKRTVTR